MKIVHYFALILLLFAYSVTVSHASPPQTQGKKKIMVISSYHREYLWSQDTNKGVVKALQDFALLNNKAQAEAFSRNDFVESSTAVIKKLWMDTKRKNSPEDILQTLASIMQEIDNFKPDIILLGDDNAANYVGNQYVDTETPLVFWGVNGSPLKYSFINSLEKPGRNITGVYQAGYLKECLVFLKKLVPGLKNFAILSDSSPSGRAKAKKLINMAAQNELPLTLNGTIITDSYAEWQTKALELQNKVDAFFVLNHNTLKDDNGQSIDQMQAGAWYLENIRKPDTAHERQFVEEGILCCVDDSGFKQGYEAVKIAVRILKEQKNPAGIAIYAPERGPFIVNRQRAVMLKLEKIVRKNPLVEEFVSKSLALEKFPH